MQNECEICNQTFTSNLQLQIHEKENIWNFNHSICTCGLCRVGQLCYFTTFVTNQNISACIKTWFCCGKKKDM